MKTEDSTVKKGIITVVGKDQVGIIAKVCTYLADNDYCTRLFQYDDDC